jgi:hypothetical protein
MHSWFSKVKNFKIGKGKHSSSHGLHFGFTMKRKITFKAILDESCLYTIPDNDKYDENKLFGFSSSWNHMIQSARIGWRCMDGKSFEIVTYSHNDGKIDFNDIKLLGTVLPNQPFICSIVEPPYYKGDPKAYYVFTFRIEGDSNISFTKNENTKSYFPFQYYLFPYFGGNKTAPHDMNIKIELIKN